MFDSGLRFGYTTFFQSSRLREVLTLRQNQPRRFNYEECKENCSFTINPGRDDRIYTGGDSSSRIQARRNVTAERGFVRSWNWCQLGVRHADLQRQRLSG